MHILLQYTLTHQGEERTCRWVVFTSDAEWEPYSEHFKESEMAMVNDHSYPDPCHPHFNQNGNRLDGHIIKSLNTADVYSTLDPSLSTFDFTYQNHHIGATSSKEHRSSVLNDVLAHQWGTSLHTAGETMKVTTQRGLQYLEGPLSQRFRTRQKQLGNRCLSTKMYTNTFFKDKTSARGNTCAQLFVTAEGFVAGRPMKKSRMHTLY
jgi:hypothetical protein